MGFKNFINDALGINAYKARKEAKSIKWNAEYEYSQYKDKLNSCRIELNKEVKDFGIYRCNTLQNTVGRFLLYLKAMNQRFSKNEYEIPDGFSISSINISEMESISMNAGQIMATTATSGMIASAALTGVPTLVTSSVGALATASTGTAISTLSGVAESNAILAWLGGGSLASGGGGIAAGTAILSGITWGVTGGLALLSAAFIASKHFEKKLTQAQNYKSEVEKIGAQVDLACDFMKQIEKRIKELKDVSKGLCNRSFILLDRMEPLISDFHIIHPYHIHLFQQTALLMKSISEISKAPVLDTQGNLSEDGKNIILKSRKLLNTEL